MRKIQIDAGGAIPQDKSKVRARVDKKRVAIDKSQAAGHGRALPPVKKRKRRPLRFGDVVKILSYPFGNPTTIDQYSPRPNECALVVNPGRRTRYGHWVRVVGAEEFGNEGTHDSYPIECLQLVEGKR
ncbi:MAG TPA: hypothetical protein GX509_07150 [Firmicutes bacterium]|nr:hypothetical protein [Bacillota bacterium]